MDARIMSGHDASIGAVDCGGTLADDAHEVGFLHDEEVLPVELDLGARPLAEQHLVADLDIDRRELSGFVASAGTNSHDLALGGLFLCRVGNDDAAFSLFLGINPFDHNTVMQRTNFGLSHYAPPGVSQPSVLASMDACALIRDGRAIRIFWQSYSESAIRWRGYGLAAMLSSKPLKPLVRACRIDASMS